MCWYLPGKCKDAGEVSSQPHTFAVGFWYEDNDISSTTVILESIPLGTTSDGEIMDFVSHLGVFE